MTELNQVVSAFEAKAKEVDTLIKSVNAESQKNGEASSKAVKMAEEAAKQLEVLTARMVETEQKLADNVMRGKESPESAGLQFTKSSQYRDFIEGKLQKARFEVKNTVTQSDATTAPDRQPGVIPGAFRTLRVRDVIPTASTGLNVIETTREASYTADAAETAEGVAKPESDVTFELVTTPIRTIATHLRVSKQLVDDAPSIANYIDVRLAYDVNLRLENQLVNGDGTSPNISGITDSGNFTAFTPLTGDSAIDSIAKAISARAVATYNPTAVMLNPADWWSIQLLKASTAGTYLMGNPAGSPGAMIWGLPVVATQAVAQGKLIVADFNQAYQFWLRQNTVVEMFEQDADNVTKNLVTLRAEMRGALESRVPAACGYGDLTR